MDFASFYDEQPDYAAFRTDPQKRQDYNISVDWKVRELIKLIPEDFKPENILEVGCAFGVLLNNIANRLQLKNRIGIDISRNNIEAAKTLYPECRFFNGTIQEFMKDQPADTENGCFDLIVLSDIVEHIPDDLGFMMDVRNVSRYVVLNLPLEKSFKTRNRQYGEQDPSGHLRCYDENDAVRLVTQAGFEVVTSFTSIGFFDKEFYKIYTRNRDHRVKSKPIPKKVFWTVYYFIEDHIKLMSKRFTGKYIGTNYFALLKSKND